MVEAILTPEIISAGKELVEQLDKSTEPVKSALWFYFGETDAYRLVLELPGMEKEGPKKSYRRIQTALKKTSSARDVLSLDEIAVAKPGNPIIELMKVVIRTGPGISGIRLTNTTINGQLIEDAFVYRLT